MFRGKTCLLGLIFSLCCINVCGASVIGSWNFNENNCVGPPFSALDSSGNNLNGIINGTTGCVPGITGSALSFTGSGEYIEVPSSSLYSPQSSLILEATVNLSGGGYPFIFNRTDAQGKGFTLQAMAPFTLSLSFDQIGHPTNNLSIGALPTDPLNPVFLLPFGQWASIKVHIDTQLGKVRFFINGVLNSEQNCPIAPLLKVDAPLKIGGIGGANGSFYSINGNIDDVRVATDDPHLTVAISGNGSGTVNSNQQGLACASALCGFYAPLGTPITLMATPGAQSSFTGWIGCISDPANSNNCSFTFDAARVVAAQFMTTNMIKIPGTPDTYFESLSNAYLNTQTSKTYVAREGIFAEDFLLDRPNTITLNGGYDPMFGNVVGKSVIKGVLVIQQGKLIVKNLQIRPPSSIYTYTSPVDGAADVTVSTPVQIKKAEQLDPVSVSSATVTLWGKDRFGSFRVPGQISYNQTVRLITVRHGGLRSGSTYTLTLSGLKNSAGTSLPDTTIRFTTLRNQVEKSVYFKEDGSVQRYRIYPPVLDGWDVQRNVEYISPGADLQWFTSDDIVGSKDDMSFSLTPTRHITHTNSYLGGDSALTSLYEYGTNGNLARGTFNPGMGFTYGIAEYSYNTNDTLDRQTKFVGSGADGNWNTYADNLVGSYTKFDYDSTGLILGEINNQLVAPNGTVLPAEQTVSYVYNYYDAKGLLSKRITYESAGANSLWFDVDDVVSGYWEYAYSNGQLIASAFYGQSGTDGVWFTSDDTLLAYIIYRYDASGNRTQAVRYNGPGVDSTWFTVDDRLAVFDIYDTLR